MSEVFGYSYGPGLGDLWIYANNLAYLSEEHSEVRFSPVPASNSDANKFQYYQDTILEILSCLDYKGTGKIIPVKDSPTRSYFRYKNSYLPTKIRHSGNRPETIVYQEDPRSVKVPAEKVATFFDCMKSYTNYTFIRLGLPVTIEQDIKLASEAKAFIGFESGMTHLCISVGTPIFLTYIPAWYYQGTHGINMCSSIEEMFEKACK